MKKQQKSKKRSATKDVSDKRDNLLKKKKYSKLIYIFLIILCSSFIFPIYAYLYPKEPDKPKGSYYVQTSYEIEVFDKTHYKNSSKIIICPVEDTEFEKEKLIFESYVSEKKSIRIYDIFVSYQINDGDKNSLLFKEIDNDKRFILSIDLPKFYLIVNKKLTILVEYSVEKMDNKYDLQIDLLPIRLGIFPSNPPINDQNYDITRVIYPLNLECIIPTNKDIMNEEITKYFIPITKKDKTIFTMIFVSPINYKRESLIAIFTEIGNAKIIPHDDCTMTNLVIRQKIEEGFYLIDIEAEFRNDSHLSVIGIPNPLIAIYGKMKYTMDTACIIDKVIGLVNIPKTYEQFTSDILQTEKDNPKPIILPNSSEKFKVIGKIPHDLRLKRGTIDNEFKIAIINFEENVDVTYRYELPEGNKLLVKYPTDGKPQINEDLKDEIFWERKKVKQGDILLFFISFANGVYIPEDYYWITSILYYILIIFNILITLFLFVKKDSIGIRLAILAWFLPQLLLFWGEIDPQETLFLENSCERFKLAFAQSQVFLGSLFSLGMALNSLWLLCKRGISK